ncbi:MAG: hypothetical protein ACHQD8_06735 [Chitinophagales bacterium]
MNIRIFSIAVVIMALPFCSDAQDKIYKINGEVIDAKIMSVGTRTVTYQRFDNQSGPEYTIMKIEVEKIAYQNGTVDSFEDMLHPFRHHIRKPDNSDGKTTEKINYRPNVLALAPLQFSENGLGAGLSYERAIDKNGIIAFYLPLMLTLNLSNGTYYDNNTGTYVNGHQDKMFYAMPGIKIYPTGCYGVVRYAIGPSLAIATGEKSSQGYTVGTGSSTYQTQSHVMVGMVINNSININPSPRIYLGLELGFGFTYLNRINGLNQDTNGLAQGSFKIGYRF